MNTLFPDYGCDVSFSVRYGEAGSNGLATLSAVGNWLQEAASESAERLGFGASTLFPMGLTWILNRLALRISRLPAAGETIVLHTWPSTLDRFGHRGYEIFDAKGTLLLSGTSSWSVLDLAARSLTAIPPFLTEAYPHDVRPVEPFSSKVLPRLKGEGSGAPVIVRKDDLDVNGHVNNTRYLAWLLEAFPGDCTDSSFPCLVDIAFRSECFLREELLSLAEEAPLPAAYAAGDACSRKAYVHTLRRKDGTDTCRALTVWN